MFKPETVHTAAELVVNVTPNPELAVALSGGGTEPSA
jgi:hypothetical protein